MRPRLKSGRNLRLALAACLTGQMPLAASAEEPAPAGCRYTIPKAVTFNDPFNIFFDWDSAAIGPDAARLLDNVVAAYSRTPNNALIISAYTDRTGSPAYNMTLGQRRAEAVKEGLRRRGLKGAISIQNYGERRPIDETPDGVRSHLNRRVDILFVQAAAPAAGRKDCQAPFGGRRAGNRNKQEQSGGFMLYAAGNRHGRKP